MNGLDPMGRDEFGNVLRDLAREGTHVVISSHILHDLETLCADFLLLRWGRMPQWDQPPATPDARKVWPESTTFRCSAPEKLARFFFDKGLVRGCEIDAATETLDVKWTDPDRF